MPAWDLPSFQLLQKALFLMVSCCELQSFLLDRWTRLRYGRVAMQTRSFTASSVYSRKSRRSCDSGSSLDTKTSRSYYALFCRLERKRKVSIEKRQLNMWFVNERLIRQCAYRGAMFTSAKLTSWHQTD